MKRIVSVFFGIDFCHSYDDRMFRYGKHNSESNRKYNGKLYTHHAD